MNTEALYELRVLSGEQRGASSVLQPGQTLRIGQDWSSEVVLQQAQGSAVLSFSAEGGLVLQAERGDCTVADHAVSPGGRDGLDLYIPFSVGGCAWPLGKWARPSGRGCSMVRSCPRRYRRSRARVSMHKKPRRQRPIPR